MKGGDVQWKGGRTQKGATKTFGARPKATRGRSCFALPFANGRPEFRRDLFSICDHRLDVRAQLVASAPSWSLERGCRSRRFDYRLRDFSVARPHPEQAPPAASP